MKLPSISRLRSLGRPQIFVRTDHPVPSTKPTGAVLVGSGTRLVPTVGDRLRVQRRRSRLTMGLCILAPTLVAAVYFWLIASDRYISDTQMILSDQPTMPGTASVGGASGGGKSSLLSLVGMGGDSAGASIDSAVVVNYLQSTEAMEALDRTIGLRKMWSAPSIDYFSRLSADASAEDFLKYYGKHVSVISSPLDPVIEVQVAAFRPQDAQLIAQTLVTLAQKKLNDSYLHMRSDALDFARSEVTTAEQQLAHVNDKLRDFRNAHRDIDPTAAAQGVGGIANGLLAQQASAEAQLKMARTYAREDSAVVKTLKSQVASLHAQVERTRGLLAGSTENTPYADLLATYEDLELDQKFAQDSYTSAMGFLAASRTALARQQTYLIDFIAPTLPQDALEPRSTRDVVMAFFTSALLWLIGSLVGSALREHARR